MLMATFQRRHWLCGLGQGDEDEFYSGFVKNAYMKADLDTIFNIRRLVDEGQLRKGAVN